jgi:hypothetical protein
MFEMMEEVKELTPDEFLRLCTVIYEAGKTGQFGDPNCPSFKAKMRARIETWLEI